MASLQALHCLARAPAAERAASHTQHRGASTIDHPPIMRPLMPNAKGQTFGVASGSGPRMVKMRSSCGTSSALPASTLLSWGWGGAGGGVGRREAPRRLPGGVAVRLVEVPVVAVDVARDDLLDLNRRVRDADGAPAGTVDVPGREAAVQEEVLEFGDDLRLLEQLAGLVPRDDARNRGRAEGGDVVGGHVFAVGPTGGARRPPPLLAARAFVQQPMSENQATCTVNNPQELALANYIAPFIGCGPHAINNAQAKFLYMGPVEPAAAAFADPQERERFLQLRTAADHVRALSIPKQQDINMLDIYRARPSAPPLHESTTQEHAIAAITERHVENERLHAERRRKRYAEMLDAINPKCITTINDRTGGHQCTSHAVVGGKYCKRHLDMEVRRFAPCAPPAPPAPPALSASPCAASPCVASPCAIVPSAPCVYSCPPRSQRRQVAKMLAMREKLIEQAAHDTAPSQPVSRRRASGEPCIHPPLRAICGKLWR
jgi:hypothetical protein